MTKPKANYVPKKRDWLQCPVCKKQFSINGAEHRSRIKRGFKEPCCSMRCDRERRKNNKPIKPLESPVIVDPKYLNWIKTGVLPDGRKWDTKKR
jgi:hypothetical protein